MPLGHPDMCWTEDPLMELSFMLHFTCWTWIIFRFNRAWLRSDNLRLASNNRLSVMVSVGNSILIGLNAIFCWNFLKPLAVEKCQICVENENLVLSFWLSEINPECSSVICGNGGSCLYVNETNKATCVCESGFNGQFCEGNTYATATSTS